MNICIITVYNSENCGSHYQALALKTILERQGHNVFFLKREDKCISHRKRRTLKVVGAALKQGHIRWAFDCLNIYQSFEKRLRTYPIIALNQMDKIDAIVIGSDTLWNLENPHFRERKDIYTGLAFPDKPCLTYAVSIANTQENILIKDLVMCEGIKKLYKVSVRDEATRAVVQTIRGESPIIVDDPTLLLDADEYRKYEGNIPDRNYILIYRFGTIPEEEKQQILAFKVERGLKIVSYGEYLAWADQNIPVNPASFLSYFRYASYVVTNTFHGTAFSIIYRKPFYSFAYNSLKVKSLLNTYGLQNQLPQKDNSVRSILTNTPDYDSIYKIIYQNRTSSLTYLKDSISSLSLKE